MVLLKSDGTVVLNPSCKRPGQLFVDLRGPLLFQCTSDYNPKTTSKLLLVSDPTNDGSFPFLTPYLPWISNIFGHWEHTDMQAAIASCIEAIDENIVNELQDDDIGLLPMIEEAGEDFDIMIEDDQNDAANRDRENQQ